MEWFLDPNTQTLAALDLALIMQLVCAALAVLIDPYISSDNRNRLYMIIVIVAWFLLESQVSARFGNELYL